MAEEPAYIRNLRALADTKLGLEHIEAIEAELYSSSDRATVILYGTYVETSLETLIKPKLRKDLNSKDLRGMFDFDGAAGTFSKKTLLAYALELIGPTVRRDCDLIRLLRNTFAHSKAPMGFDTAEVKAVCDQLQTPDLPGAYVPYGYLSRVSDDQLAVASDKATPKTRFIMACHNISHRMMVARGEAPEVDNTFKDDPLP